MTLRQDASESIRIARTLAIFFVIYAHAYFSNYAKPEVLGDIFTIYYVRYVFQDGLGHMAVPALSLISGYLGARLIGRRNYLMIIKNKSRTLILPIIFWSGVTLSVYLALGTLSGDHEFIQEHLPNTLSDWIDALFAVSSAPFAGPLHFLRDIFVCFLLFPVLAAIMRLSGCGWWYVPALSIFWLQGGWPLNEISLFGVPLFLRPEIFCLFGIGMFLSKTQRLEDYLRSHRPHRWILLVSAFGLVGITTLNLFAVTHVIEELHTFISQCGRFFGILALLSLSSIIQTTRISSVFILYEKYAFMAFCSHVAMNFTFAQIVGVMVGWNGDTAVWHGAFFLSPLLCFLASQITIHILLTAAPIFVPFLTGGRVSAPQKRARDTRQGASTQENERA